MAGKHPAYRPSKGSTAELRWLSPGREISFFQTPTPHSAPRRGNMDAQDRLWFDEHRGDRTGMFHTKTREFKEWKLNTHWSAPYDVVLDKNEDAWTA